MASISSFIPSEEIKKLAFGSYESLCARVSKAIQEAAPRLFGAECTVEGLSTFNGHAIVVAEAKCYRVKFEESDRGVIVPVHAEPLSTPVYKTVEDFAVRESKAFVDDFFSGAKTSGTERIQSLIPMIKEKVVPTPEKVMESFSLMVQGERPWKKFYTESLSKIQAQLQTEWAALEESRTHAKFTKLYDGGLQESELSGYRDLVTSDLKYLSQRVGNLHESVENAVKAYTAKSAAKTDKKDTVKMFEAFADDFFADISGVKKSLSEAIQLLNRVDRFGKIYDVLADELFRYEAAGRFVEKMARALSEAATEE
jgi:hypothetical protein